MEGWRNDRPPECSDHSLARMMKDAVKEGWNSTPQQEQERRRKRKQEQEQEQERQRKQKLAQEQKQEVPGFRDSLRQDLVKAKTGMRRGWDGYDFGEVTNPPTITDTPGWHPRHAGLKHTIDEIRYTLQSTPNLGTEVLRQSGYQGHVSGPTTPPVLDVILLLTRYPCLPVSEHGRKIGE